MTSTTPRNAIIGGDCIDVMRSFERASADFILTDPPYITRYRGRDGRTVATGTEIHQDVDRCIDEICA